ncbi:hypothetical protein ElyMa_000620300 [Elysia marginata]|uniref:Uncharacterized protein n=1 Tax=Elysia marginata TaxID=1093978 RepID=A0AAV4GBV2_9GAST|nr:hypothetical protein ElyMa_000620300 [Elysia marginata]
MERHGGVDREQLIKLQQEDPRIQELVDAGRTSRRGGKVVSFEKARGIVYRRYEDPGRNSGGAGCIAVFSEDSLTYLGLFLGTSSIIQACANQ